MSLTRDDVAHLASLARLTVTEEELGLFAGQLDVIIAAVAAVSEVAAAEVPPTSHPLPLTNVTRPDVVVASLPVGDALAAAPAAEDGRFRVPRMLDDPE
jgi:aspartyl-tRNA(Asn)/glutamyl-tRNA(Gln) amidotransferase subunit C